MTDAERLRVFSMATYHLRLSALPPSRSAMRIAIIDSGVHASHPHVLGVAGGVGIDDGGFEHPDWVDRLGHGTAVAAVIREKVPSAEIYCAKVFDRSLAATGEALISALRWARGRQVRLVNLSLGTTNVEHQDPIAREVSAALADGIVIVAAAPDARQRWLPGALHGVVGVELDTAMPRDEAVVAIDHDRNVRVRASGYPRPIPGVPPERNLKGLSFAVANATGLLARVMDQAGGEDLYAALAGISSTSPSG